MQYGSCTNGGSWFHAIGIPSHPLTPPELIGRITGTSNALQNASTLLAPMSGAFFAGFFSISAVFLGAGLGLVLLGSGYLLHQLLRPAPVKQPEKSHAVQK